MKGLRGWVPLFVICAQMNVYASIYFYALACSPEYSPEAIALHVLRKRHFMPIAIPTSPAPAAFPTLPLLNN